MEEEGSSAGIAAETAMEEAAASTVEVGMITRGGSRGVGVGSTGVFLLPVRDIDDLGDLTTPDDDGLPPVGRGKCGLTDAMTTGASDDDNNDDA